MRRGPLLLGAVALGMLGLAAFALSLWLTTPSPGVTLENFRRIHVGMSQERAEAMLGRPAEGVWDGIPSLCPPTHVWVEGELYVYLDICEDGQVVGGVAFAGAGDGAKQEVPLSVSENWLDCLRRWLRW